MSNSLFNSNYESNGVNYSGSEIPPSLFLKKDLDSLPREIPLMFIQNGLLHIQFIDTLKQSNIILGSVLHGATKSNPATVQHLGVGVTSIGIYKGKWTSLEQFLHSNIENFLFNILKIYTKSCLKSIA